MCEQPFKITARIPIKPVPEVELGTSTIEMLKCKPVAVSNKRKVRKSLRRIRDASVTLSMSQLRGSR